MDHCFFEVKKHAVVDLFQLIFQGFSVSVWVNIHTYPAVNKSQHTFFRANEKERSGFKLKLYRKSDGRNTIQFVVSDSRPGAATYISRLNLDLSILNTWNHFIFTYKFTNHSDPYSHFTAYFNGASTKINFVKVLTYINDTFTYSPSMLGGTRGTEADSKLSVDELSIYDCVLDAVHASELYLLY